MRLKCRDCDKRTNHIIEGNVKVCNICKLKTSYKYDSSKFRKRITERRCSGNYSGEQSPYWNWISERATVFDGGNKHTGEIVEFPEANPDWISESNVMYRPCSESDKEKFDLIMANISKLSQKEREVIQLLWEGKKATETAALLSISPGEVRTYLFRARKKLEICMRKGR